MMSSLSVQDLGLLPAQLRAVQKKAKHDGKTAPEYVRGLIERDLLADKNFDEILRPIREDFRKRGITEAQLDELVDRARKSTRAGSKRRRSRR